MRFLKRFKAYHPAKFDLGIEINNWMEVIALKDQIQDYGYGVSYHYHNAFIVKFGFYGFALILNKYKEEPMKKEVAQSIGNTLKRFASL